MTTTLADVLLVLLSDGPRTVQDLHQRHRDTLGPARQVDITRVVSTMTRLERLGHIRPDAARSRAQYRVWTVTDAGHRSWRAWILDVRAGAAQEDIVVRALLALAATDRPTYETVIAACTACLETRRHHPRRRRPLSAPDALDDLDDAVAATALRWLRRLRTRPRARARVT
ncbi:hypothetical protein [Catenuloplanes japonicus]|uniref:hypothetical protein n=1 Tax=Catenuloplanes japonicus TaxID=33876 RepID=UPI0005277614|nr:hypothetical protein [Catenuloplanes japonicus]